MRELKLLHRGEYTELMLCRDDAGELFVRKSSPSDGREKLASEAAFIQSYLPKTARRYFPRVLNVMAKGTANDDYFYDMPYYDGKLLRKRLLEAASLKDALIDLAAAVGALKGTLYTCPATVDPASFCKHTYIKRIQHRLAKYTALGDGMVVNAVAVDQLSEKQLHSLFSELLSRPTIIVNGKKMLSPLEILRRLSEDEHLSRIILPAASSMSLIHGDPHSGNVLVRSGSSEPLFFDPNGFAEGGDIGYDLGKFILSTDYLDYLLEEKLVPPKITYKDGMLDIDELRQFKNNRLRIRAEKLHDSLINELLPDIFRVSLEKDPMLIKRAVFVAGLHAFACAHTFIPTQKKAASVPLLVYYTTKANQQLAELEAINGMGIE